MPIELLEALVPGPGRVLVEELLSSVKCTREGFLLFIKDLFYFDCLLRNLGEARALAISSKSAYENRMDGSEGGVPSVPRQ